MEQQTPDQLTFDERPGYLYARIEARHMTSMTSKAYLRDIRPECSRVDLRAVLIARHVPRVNSVVELFNIAGNSVPILMGIKVACLNPFPENQQMMEFATLSANDRGARYALFTEEADAEAWLLDVPSPPLHPIEVRSPKVH